MALLKLGTGIDSLSGKIGGQSISITRNGISIKNIAQPRRQATNKQSIQRFSTASITNKWQKLTPGQRSAWNATASNYTYTDKFGNVATRNGFQVFCFLNQNRNILGLSKLLTAPVYTPIIKPTVTLATSTEREYNIEISEAQAGYEYVIYGQIHYSLGAETFTETPIEIGIVSSGLSTFTVNVAPLFEANYPVNGRSYSGVIQVVAIDTVSGNRDLNPVTIANQVIQPNLSFNILSYYSFAQNANDYFGVNNGVITNASVGTNGLVNGALTLTGGKNSWCSLGNDSSLNFTQGNMIKPFAIAYWIKVDNFVGAIAPFAKVFFNQSGPVYINSLATGNNSLFTLYDGDYINRLRVRGEGFQGINSWQFVCISYKSATEFSIVVNDTNNSVITSAGSFSLPTANASDFRIGHYLEASNIWWSGKMSELTMFNQSLSYNESQLIRQANLNGQTILDIN